VAGAAFSITGKRDVIDATTLVTTTIIALSMFSRLAIDA